MTDPDLTAIAVVLDRSGSMNAIRSDAEGGVNQFVEDQRNEPGRATLTLAQFDDVYELLLLNEPLERVRPITLQPRGRTALLDAMGRTIVRLGEALAALPEDERPGKVLFVTVTDGLENASQEWTREKVFEAVTEQRDKWKWEFVFLAANQDAIATGAQLGISRDAALTFAATGEGARAAAGALSGYASRYRTTGATEFTDADRRQP
jgi:hypothetical protein